MKKLILALTVILTFSFAGYSSAKDDNNKPVISFTTTNHKFENVSSKDTMLNYDFEFVNTGNSNLIIYYVTSSCDCVKGEYPKNIIAPGQKGKIKVSYLNSSPGPFKEKLIVKSNAKPFITNIFIEGWNKYWDK